MTRKHSLENRWDAPWPTHVPRNDGTGFFYSTVVPRLVPATKENSLQMCEPRRSSGTAYRCHRTQLRCNHLQTEARLHSAGCSARASQVGTLIKAPLLIELTLPNPNRERVAVRLLKAARDTLDSSPVFGPFGAGTPCSDASALLSCCDEGDAMAVGLRQSVWSLRTNVRRFRGFGLASSGNLPYGVYGDELATICRGHASCLSKVMPARSIAENGFARG